MGWNYLSIPKPQRSHRWSLGMDKYVHPTHYNGCNYLSMLSGGDFTRAALSGSAGAGQQIGCCCCNSLPTVINPDYNMTKQRYITRIYDKIRPKSPPNRATSPTCRHCDVTHLSLTRGVVALHISSQRVGVREEHRQARKTVRPINAGRVICRYQNNLCGIINHHKHIWECFCDV